MRDYVFRAVRRLDLSRRLLACVCCLASGWLTAEIEAEEPAAPDPPKIALASPLAIVPGQTTRVVLRGWSLDKATAVRSLASSCQVRLLKQGAAAVPGRQDAKQVGDSQVELEIMTPDDFAGDEASLVVTAPGGTAEILLLVGGTQPIMQEQEPNDGFQQAQQVAVNQIVEGQIHADRNVDVFTFSIEKQGTFQAEVLAARRGSALDGALVLYTERGDIVARSDDALAADPRLAVELSPGRYFLSLSDALDRGGPAHPYRLTLQQ
ncbi:hypothetical protein [Lignipirellula cremea]|uniref:Peptidase C-terminal archaeal/bacterial domain-containing protein n=1 Tax=Lignipirellula cremea TaxID=2528010 RepID=A0A518DT04_9BACT|nr:hypothetical protein [Lignipirellula cremea]QDU94976.1 hypothetical protein Pla8534_27850 [Lignipirellula cremea]